ncbi:MAG: ATP-dependent RecD-like DNA helicase [Alistipes senegalensis]|nr:ATP-dependent RecD-like DNA helicase [Alistipes senegalensis]
MEQQLMRIQGTVEHIVFRSETTGYTVFDFDSGGEWITAVGELCNIQEGETLIITGAYTTHSRFGTQFKIESYEEKLPDTAINIEKYLASGAIKGIGAKLSNKIVNHFGDKTLEILEKEPERLAELKISKKRYDSILAEIKKVFALKNLVSFLKKYDIPFSDAMKIYLEYGVESLDDIKENPYILCGDNIRLEFKKADIIADELDCMEENFNSRIVAFIRNELRKNADNNGHSCIMLDYIIFKLFRELEISSRELKDNIIDIIKKASLKDKITGIRDFYIYKHKDILYISLPEYYKAEKYIYERITSMASEKSNVNCELFINDEEKRNNIKYESLQREAINSAVSEKIFILTGGPGTGKTTTLNAIISIMDKKGMKVFLAAPTGRAAKRLSDITGHNAKTIHRLLEVRSDTGNGFSRNEKNPLNCDAVIIDEFSMVDVLLFEALLRAMKSSCKLIITGDSDQLPSVNAGNLLHDIINGQAIKVIRLEEVFRQAQQSCIITNAHKIVTGEYPDLTQKDNDFFFFRRPENESAVRLIVDLVKERLPNAYGYSPSDDIQILAPSRKGILGTKEINRILQNEINFQNGFKTEYTSLAGTFRTGDKVMQNVNNYDIEWVKNGENGKGIFNGDIGKIIIINLSKKTATIDFDGRIAEYPFEMLIQIELAYAVTVHKSQGCEFEVVIMPVQDGFDMLNHRNLLYTAVTRAKKLLIIIGNEYVIHKMVDNVRGRERYTNLENMF